MEMAFPERLITEEEIRRARELIEAGYRHDIRVEGSEGFIKAVGEALELIREAGDAYWDMVRAYIRSIIEIKGFSQLRPDEACLWLSPETVENPVLAASFIVQKAVQMKNYIEGRPFYGHRCEMETTRIRYDFIRALRERTKDERIRRLCDEVFSELEASLYDLLP